MNILEPSVKLLEEVDSISHVARCARVCYGKETGNDDDNTITNLINNKHFSVFRHSTCYYIIPIEKRRIIINIINEIYNISFLNNIKCAGIDVKLHNNTYYVVCNGNFLLDHYFYDRKLANFKVPAKEFEQTEVGYSMMRYTFAITTQISTSREFNRVSPNNIVEQSTRYVYEDGCIVRPHWVSKEIAFHYEHNNPVIINTPELKYLHSCDKSFHNYKVLIDAGVKKQDARGLLPLDTATKVIYTYSVDEWKHICDLRCDKRAHPNAQIIANMIKTELNDLGYDI